MKLQDYRKLLGLSRAKVAAQLGTTGTTIYRYETGRMLPSVKAATRIREWSKGAVTLEDLVGGKT
jgi:transcriptional regulator with XRE-family HTH domain